MKAAVRRILMLGAMLSPQALYALGLGDIKLNSALNQPFDAEIELVAATPEDLSTLRATLASGEVFQRYGLDRPAFLTDFGFQVAKSGGRDVLRVTSSKPVIEPFVTLLVEANWPRGRLLREYTVLLDPPVYAPAAAATAAPVATPRTAAPAPSAAETSYEEPAPAAATPRRTTPVAASIEPGSTYQVRRNDTLWSIASAAHPGGRGDVNRAMLAIYQNNAQAFDGNINLLRAGASLQIPADDELAAISASAAAEEVSRQYREWREGRASGSSDAGRLRLVTPDQGSTAASSAPATTGTSADLQNRVQQLESELAEARRMLEVRNAELATLQGGQSGAPVEEPAAPLDTGVAPASELPAGATGEGSAATSEPAAEPAAVPEETAPQPKPTPAVKPTPEAESGGLLSLLGDYWWALLGLLVALAGGVYLLRKRRDETDGESLEEAFGRRDSGADLRARPVVVGRPREADILVEEKRPADTGVTKTANLGTGSATGSFGAAAAAKAPEPARKPATIDDTISGELAPNLEAGDPLAEADFHMAYGLYDQAADLVQLAMKREPDRRDLQLKLTEIYFVWGNRDKFVEVAREMHSSRSEAAPGEWDKVVIMGKQIAPDDPLFASAVAGAGAGALDLDLLEGSTDLDLDFPGSASTSSGPDIDLTGSRPQLSEGVGLDFILDEPQRGGRESDALSPTVEALSPTIEQLAPTVETTGLRARDQSESTQEVDLESLGLDIDMTAELDDIDRSDDIGATASRKYLDDTVEQTLRRAAPRAAVSDEDLLDATSIMRGGTGEMPAFEMPGDGAAIILDSSDSTSRIRLDESTHIQPAPDLGGVDFSLGDEAATMSEVGTKLDLARAYIDMGDPEGARSILEEVLSEGNATQKQEADRLMAGLP